MGRVTHPTIDDAVVEAVVVPDEACPPTPAADAPTKLGELGVVRSSKSRGCETYGPYMAGGGVRQGTRYCDACC